MARLIFRKAGHVLSWTRSQCIRILRNARVASVLVFVTIAFVQFSLILAFVPNNASAFTMHDPILIMGDPEFTAANGVVGGDGSPANPFVISGWEILTDTAIGIDIRNTSMHYSIENCSIHGQQDFPGIALDTSPNGSVIDVHAYLNSVGVATLSTSDLRIEGCNLSQDSDSGIRMVNPIRVNIINCSFSEDGTGVSVLGVSNNITIAKSNMNNNTAEGISFDALAEDIAIENNTVSDCDGNGIGSSLVTDRCLIANNSVARCSGSGVTASLGNYSRILHNSVSDCFIVGIAAGREEDIEGRNLVAWNEVRNNQYGGLWCFGDKTDIESNFVEGSTIEAGIWFMGSNCTISNNTIANNTPYGLLIDVAPVDNLISGNTFVNDGAFLNYYEARNNSFTSNIVNGLPLEFLENVNGYAVHDVGQVIAVNCTGIEIQDIDLSNSSVAIELASSSECTVRNVTVRNNGFGVYAGYGSNNNSITECTFANCTSGIFIEWLSDGILVQGNNISSCDNGVLASLCSHTQVLNNTVDACYEGIGIFRAALSVVNGNAVSGCFRGIGLYEADDNLITSNTVIDSMECGIRIYELSQGNTVADNNISGASDGILLRGASDNCTITRNYVANCKHDGILIWASAWNIISWNTITGNAQGVELYGGGPGHNFLFLNSFDNNTQNAWSDWIGGPNYWNTSEPVEYIYMGTPYSGYMGNYWDDYGGDDMDFNGIGDTPYSIGDSADNYPLMPGTEFVPEFELVPVVAVTLTFVVLIGLSRWLRR